MNFLRKIFGHVGGEPSPESLCRDLDEFRRVHDMKERAAATNPCADCRHSLMKHNPVCTNPAVGQPDIVRGVRFVSCERARDDRRGKCGVSGKYFTPVRAPVTSKEPPAQEDSRAGRETFADSMLERAQAMLVLKQAELAEAQVKAIQAVADARSYLLSLQLMKVQAELLIAQCAALCGPGASRTPTSADIGAQAQSSSRKKADKAVYIHGPQGCGKTTHGATLAKHYGKTCVIDADELDGAAPGDALVLCQEPTAGSIPFDVALIAMEVARTVQPLTDEVTRMRAAMDAMTQEVSALNRREEALAMSAV